MGGVFDEETRRKPPAGTMVIGEVDEAAEVRLNPQCVKVVAARLHAPDKGWSLARIHRHPSNAIRAARPSKVWLRSRRSR